MLRPNLILVGSDRGGVGKTTTARALVEYFEIMNIDVKAYDSQSPLGNLYRYHRHLVEVIDIEDTRDQCRLLEDMNFPGRVTILDLCAGSFAFTLKFLEEVGVFAAAASGRLNLVVLHLVGRSRASKAEMEVVKPFLGACDYRVVRNLTANSAVVTGDPLKGSGLKVSQNHAPQIVIPQLDAIAFEAVELSGASFTSFVLDQDHDGKSSRRSFVLRGYVKTWLEQVWDNFEAAGINNLIAVRNQKKIASAQNHKHHNKKQRGDQGNERFQAR
jgi:uncharacterized protein YaiI (UPF0178 family)